MDLVQILSLPLSQFFSATTAAYVLCALGIALQFGFTGLLNFGQAAFAAVGAYAYAIGDLFLKFGPIGSVVFAIVCATIFALILGLPTLRLRADYMAIVTIAAAETFRLVMTSGKLGPWTGGTEGLDSIGNAYYSMNPIPQGIYEVIGIPLTEKQLWSDLTGWTAVAVCAVLMWILTRSPWGRALKGIREDEDALKSLGKNTFAYKMQALTIGGIFGAFGGIVFSIDSLTVQPTVFGTNFTFMCWTLLLLGGAATVLGPIAGGMVFFVLFLFLRNFLQGLQSAGILPFITQDQANQFPFVVMGSALMLLVIFKPQGFFGNKKETQING
ncbi:MAG: branched-chain amino acid ABC transporter permease, partial [Actinomycetes bacterium]